MLSCILNNDIDAIHVNIFWPIFLIVHFIKLLLYVYMQYKCCHLQLSSDIYFNKFLFAYRENEDVVKKRFIVCIYIIREH